MRRFLLWRREDATGVSGTGIVAEGCQFGDGTTVVRWRGETRTTTVHADLASVERVHLHGGKTRLLWCDKSECGPRTVIANFGLESQREEIRPPDDRLHDGWREPNGACDARGVALHVGQRIRLLGGGEISDEGEIVDFIVYAPGAFHVGVHGATCSGLSGFRIDEIEAIDTTTEQTLARNGGTKPSYGWSPAIRIGAERGGEP